jgi:hypothetical protein
MKRFDQQAIKERMLAGLRVNLDWSIISENSEVDALLSEIADSEAELARYIEYLFNETKWENALNQTSLTHLGSLIGRKANRNKSAIGFVIVSATDPNGVDRLANLGKYFFNIDTYSDYDDLEQNNNTTLIYKKALTPWMASKNYKVPKGSRVLTSSGIEFLTTKTVESRALNEPFSRITADSTKLSNFYVKGGWDGIKYLKIPVIQGKIKKVDFGKVTSARFESFKINSTKVENASNSISETYLKFIVTQSNGDVEEWAQVQNIYLADAYDKVFESYTSDDGKSTIFRVGNGITGALLPENSTLTIQYLESEGAAGNVEEKYSLVNLIFPENETIIDPRTNSISNFLSVTNITPIGGGCDAEDEDSYREDAPVSYLEHYALGTIKSYEEYIRKNSPTNLSHLRVYSENETNSVYTEDDSLIENVADSFKETLNKTCITAINSEGEALSDPDDELINPLVLSLQKQKATTDSFKYVAPNFLDFRVSTNITTVDNTISTSEITDTIKTLIGSKYSIDNTEFYNSIQKSEMIKLIKAMTFTKKVSLKLEAKATVSMDKDSLNLYTYKNSYGNTISAVAIPFKFSSIFGRNSYKQGFKNYLYNSKYLLRVDLAFKNDSSKIADNRTFFLLDKRNKTSEASNSTLEEAKSLYVSKPPLIISSIETPYGTLNMFDETKETFNDRCVRIAQFPYITDNITDEYWEQLESFNSSPSENRPYVVDTEGKNQSYLASAVTSSLAVVPEGGTGTYVYKKNSNYIDGLNIFFEENYEDYTSDSFSFGLIFLPLDYLGFTSSLSKLTTDTEKLILLSQLLSSYVNLSVTAEPLLEDIEPYNENDFLSIRDLDSDIIVSREIEVN